jgi:cyclopropane fatty-acyl-phospholipid synthase-like methyltransferase
VDHVSYQERYFDRDAGGNVRLKPTTSAYVRRHLERTVAAADLRPGQRILEVGAGLGRFTSLLLGGGLDVVASDLSPGLLAMIAARHPEVRTLACDVADVARHAGERFDRIVGFFMLHHLDDLDRVFAGLREAIGPGGRVAFCEPNAWCLLYYLQITFSHQMTWRGDGGVLRMRPSVVLPAMRRAGFEDLRCTRYGFTPPALYNRAAGRRLDHALERLPLLEPLRAFQTFEGALLRC